MSCITITVHYSLEAIIIWYLINSLQQPNFFFNLVHFEIEVMFDAVKIPSNMKFFHVQHEYGPPLADTYMHRI